MLLQHQVVKPCIVQGKLLILPRTFWQQHLQLQYSLTYRLTFMPITHVFSSLAPVSGVTKKVMLVCIPPLLTLAQMQIEDLLHSWCITSIISGTVMPGNIAKFHMAPFHLCDTSCALACCTKNSGLRFVSLCILSKPSATHKTNDEPRSTIHKDAAPCSPLC